ncbi:NADPH-dependent FMN reductase [Secundilactobacillus folii]|uniref:NADPH-dependent FMN reductase n=1 Tax=Secundilactobacillus folii TaxID=2678357 RepID=A0A7X3C3M2_9LACO|nr:NADPH-dependent FMN reductase [Secundilactobacillus folii]MTV82667.1 NADPH-dependent FMN reductase [Secundilactobacillus folii]
MKFVAIVGSNADISTNRQLLKYMQKHFKQDAEIELCEIKDVPVFDEPSNVVAPAPVQEISERIKHSDGVLISTPEYDHSVPAALKSLLEWLSYTSHVLYNKPVMITGASHGTLGSSRAQNHLRQILDSPEISARVMPSAEFLLGNSQSAFDENGELVDTQKIAELEQDFNEFIDFTSEVKRLLTAHEVVRPAVPLWKRA